MNDIAIKVENLSKRYRIGLKEEMHDTLAGALTDFVKRPVKNLRQLRRLSTFSEDGRDPEDIIWALKDVSFEVERGEVVGIIGRNGAGKSTLLKILSRITEPTHGRVELNGRVSSLLEVGTGFHPELTGRENIFLNGAILGMTKAEIDHKFDEIVDFSGVEKFIDTPVKRYSSGMQVRLAFSVAAHLEPEILLVDEVLAVGDMQFQRKCLNKMHDTASEGRTVLFVSHNMGAIGKLCARGILLDDGEVLFDGRSQEAITTYTQYNLPETEQEAPIRILNENFETDSVYRIIDLDVLDHSGNNATIVATGDYICFRIHFVMEQAIPNPGFRLCILSEDRNELLRVSTDPISGFPLPPLDIGNGYIDCIIPKFPFAEGTYLIDIGLMRPFMTDVHDVENAAVLRVQGSDVYGSGYIVTNKFGFFTCDHYWDLAYTDNTEEVRKLAKRH